MSRKLLTACLLLALFIVSGRDAGASTAAFCGVVKITSPSKAKGSLRQFSVAISYFDYISWGKFGRQSRTGELITRQIKTVGTACVMNGRLVNAATIANAMRPGHWGYFYEDTWLDLQTTPDFTWGEVVSREPGLVMLRVHRTHKDIHLETNPPRELAVPIGKTTQYRIENQPATREAALKTGNWLQVHEPREQIICVWTSDAAFRPEELLPADEGKRGFANDLTCQGILGKVTTPSPNSVLDLSANVSATLRRGSEIQASQLSCRKVSFVFDGKLAPPSIAVKAKRRAVLCFYRKEKSPHKILVRSDDDATRGTILAADANSFRVKTPAGEQTIAISETAQFQSNGAPVKGLPKDLTGKHLVVYPKRGRTCIAFEPMNLDPR